MMRGATLPHSHEVFDVGGAFAMSSESFGSQAMLGGFPCPCRFLDTGHGLTTFASIIDIGSGLVVSLQSSWCQQLEASGFATSL